MEPIRTVGIARGTGFVKMIYVGYAPVPCSQLLYCTLEFDGRNEGGSEVCGPCNVRSELRRNKNA